MTGRAPSGTFDTAGTVLRRALAGGGIVTLGVGVAAGGVGFLVAGPGGLASGLVAAALALVFLGLTIVGLLATGPMLARSGTISVAPFAVLMVGWLVKVAVFVGAMLVLRDQPWVQPTVLYLSLVVAVLAFLILDVVVVARARIPVGATEP